MLKPFEDLLNARVLSQPQHVATVDPGQTPGAGNDQEAECPDTLEHVRIGAFR